jgi:hypothetical protein
MTLIKRINGMNKDRRENGKLTRDELEKNLNRNQLTALVACQHFGWELKFIRSPLNQEPVPVLYNARIDQIGVMEPDGQINVNSQLVVRADIAGSGPVKRPSQQHKTPDPGLPNEKRKDMPPVPDNFEVLLNKNQMLALRQIETFGWQLHFVRRPLFQDPLPVILGPEGDRYATLELDGRINMTPDQVLRKEAPVDQAEAIPAVPAATIKQTG